MLSTSFVFKRLQCSEQAEKITRVAWNKVDGWLAFGGDQGLLRIIMIEPTDDHDFNLQGVAARPSRVSIDRRLTTHEGACVTSITWNEGTEQITTGDNRGSVVVCGYQEGKWNSMLVNESVQSPVISAVWASDASKILIFYQSGQILLGASTGHKILSMQLRQPDAPKFAFVTDSRYDIFIIGWETKVIAYDFDSNEKYRIPMPNNDKLVSGTMLEFKENEDPKLIVITLAGHLLVFNALGGQRIVQSQVSIIPTDVAISPNAQYIAISGTISEQAGVAKQDVNKALVKLIRARDLEPITNIRIPALVATCVTWDASSLRLAIGTESAVFLSCMRLSYRHFMLNDGTVVYSTGSSFIKQSNQIISQNKFTESQDEQIIFWKPPSMTMHARWPINFVDQCACGQYLAMIQQKAINKSDGSTKQAAAIILHNSVGAPVITVELNYVPIFIAGSDNYLVTASPSRISLFDIRFLSGDVKDQAVTIDTKLDAGQVYSGLVEWHADSSPFAQDRELHVAKLTVATPITCVAISNGALFVARNNGTIQRFTLPSLNGNTRVQTGVGLKAIRCNCNGTSIAGVTDDNQLIIYFTDDYSQVEGQAIKLRAEKMTKKKDDKPSLAELENQDDLTNILGFNGDMPAAEQVQAALAQPEQGDKQHTLPPWDTGLNEVWGLQWNDEDPNLLAASSKHKILVILVDKHALEDPITSSAHIVSFKGLQVSGVYLDELVMYGQPNETGSLKNFETQQLRTLKEILYGKSQLDSEELERSQNLVTYFEQGEYNPQRQQYNLSQSFTYLQSQQRPHPFLYKLVAEAALRELALDTASQCYIRASDYISYHFTEYIRRIGSDELRRAEIAVFLSDFIQAEYILVKQLGRIDLNIKNEEELGMWVKIIQVYKDAEYNPTQQAVVSDALATKAYRQLGIFYMRQRRYVEAVTFLEKANDIPLFTEALYRAEMYDQLRLLASTLQVDAHYDAIVHTSKILARIGDVDGSTIALLRLNKPEDAIKTCITLKRFDKAIFIAQEFNMLDVVDKHLSEYLRQLLSSGDDKAALDLLRKTNQGEIAACIIIGAAMEEFKKAVDERIFPLKPELFNRLRRLIVLAGKEALIQQRTKMENELKNGHEGQGLLTEQAADATLQNLLQEDDSLVKKDEEKKEKDEDHVDKQEILDDPMFQRFGNKLKSVSMIWKLVKQTRYIVLSSYMLYMGKPEQALFPALEASGFYQKSITNVGNLQNVVDEEYRYLQRIALPIAIFSALQVEDFELASQLLEVLESDESIPSIEHDQIEQLAVDVFSRFPPHLVGKQVKDSQLSCEKCRGLLPRFSTVCGCGWQATLCSRTGQPIKPGQKLQKCPICNCLATIGKAAISVCPMCHEQFQ